MRSRFVLLFIVSLYSVLLVANQQKLEYSTDISCNQIGYFVDQPKIASIRKCEVKTFTLCDATTHQEVYRGKISPSKYWDTAGEKIRQIDFTKFKNEGTYYIVVPTLGRSASFVISNMWPKDLLKSTIKSYYYWRSGMSLKTTYAGKWNRPNGHPDTVVFIHPSASSSNRNSYDVISASKGWYDAGDYNKYIVNSGITCYTLMSSYLFSKDKWDDLSMNIPESTDSIPDILNEIRYNLEWMLSMQDPHDGGVYHKLTSPSFAGEIMPSKDIQKKRFVVQKSTGATLNFTAVMAKAAEVYNPFDSVFAKQCLEASLKGWQWAIENPRVLYDQKMINQKYQPVIVTGAYNNKDVKDEFAWAACELYLTTGQKSYLSFAQKQFLSMRFLKVPNWGNTAMLGIYSLLENSDKVSRKDQDVMQLDRKLLVLADQLLDAYYASPNKTAFGNVSSDYKWGSNAIAANQGMLLLYAWKITGRQAYYKAALSNADYILGRNPMGYCYVTGFGNQSPRNPHHRISSADDIDDPIPGLLVGGATNLTLTSHHFPSSYPSKRYLDQYSCYVTNEVAINWNAPLVFLLSGLFSNL